MTRLNTGRSSIYFSPRQQAKHDLWVKQQKERQRQQLLKHTKRVNNGSIELRKRVKHQYERIVPDDIYIDRTTKRPKYADVNGTMYKLACTSW